MSRYHAVRDEVHQLRFTKAELLLLNDDLKFIHGAGDQAKVVANEEFSEELKTNLATNSLKIKIIELLQSDTVQEVSKEDVKTFKLSISLRQAELIENITNNSLGNELYLGIDQKVQPVLVNEYATLFMDKVSTVLELGSQPDQSPQLRSKRRRRLRSPD